MQQNFSLFNNGATGNYIQNKRNMKILLLAVGKTSTDYIAKAVEQYSSRIVHYVPFSFKAHADAKIGKNTEQSKQKELEGEMILKELSPSDLVMLLDERGKQYTSREFATFLSDKMVTLPSRLVFIIGGPFGFSQQVYARANAMLSVSKMTFTHEMIRLVFTEQIYRAMTIIRGEQYHHD